MKICLVFPRSVFLEDPMVFPPLGLWYLWPVLEKAGHEVDFVDMSQRNIKAEELPEGFDVYLVSGTSPQGREIRKIGRELARRGATAVLGGPHATNYSRNSRRYYPVVVRREGEEAILKAVDIAVNKRPPLMTDDDVKSLSRNHPAAWEKFNAGIVELPLISDLGKILLPDRSRASDYHYFLEDERGNKRRGTTMFTSRGCPMRCDFCDSPNLWSRRVRYIPVEKIAEEYDQIRNLGFEAIQYYDDILPINPARTKAMCLLMKEAGFIWRCFGRVDVISHHGGRDYLKFMYAHGLREILIGIESGSQKILDGIHKGTTVGQNAAVFRWCDEIGIRCKLSFIVGLPGETKETLAETQKFLRDTVLSGSVSVRHKVDLCAYIPMAGTPIYKSVMRRRGCSAEMEETFDDYGYRRGEEDLDFDISWSADAALLDNFFYEPDALEVLDKEAAVDEIFYKGKKGSVRQIVETSALSREELTAARREMEEMVRVAGFGY